MHPVPVKEFAIRLSSIDDLFWPFDARPIAERQLNADVRWALLDEWDRVRNTGPTVLTLVVPEADRARTDEHAVVTAIRRSLHQATGPLRRIDPLTRQEKIAFWLGILVWCLTIFVATAIDRASSDDVFASTLSQAIVLFGWVALWPPASRVLTEVLPHVFNRRRIAQFAELPVHFRWVGPPE